MKLKSLSDLKELLPASERKTTISPERTHDGKGKTVRVTLDTKGRKGKSVTLITGFQHNPDTMKDIARILKEHCGAGGTVKGNTIEIQGDQRERVAAKLGEIGYVTEKK